MSRGNFYQAFLVIKGSVMQALPAQLSFSYLSAINRHKQKGSTPE